MANQKASIIYNPLPPPKLDIFGNPSQPEGITEIVAEQPRTPTFKAVLDPWNKVYYSETPLSASELPKGYINKVQSQMLNSFNAHTDGWNKYFESSYKSPRIAEDNNMLIQQNSQGKSNGSATGNQLNSSDSLKIPHTVGTGVGSSTVSLNPFGTLDAGLNI